MMRRSFFGVAAGAVVAGPGMAKQAIASTVSELSSLGVSSGVPTPPWGGVISGGAASAKQAGIMGAVSQIANAKDKLALLSGLTPALRAKYKARAGVHQLDPDIASYRSIALHAKIDWQRERNVEAMLRERTSWWERVAGGLDPYGPYEDELP
jgi:hypothetical protein